MKKNILIVVIFVIAIMLLGGCCCCPTCPPPIEEEYKVLADIPYCPIGDEPYTEITKGMINHMRDIAPLALRLGFGRSELPDLKDALKVVQKASDEISNRVKKDIYDEKPDELIKKCLFQHPNFPVGHIKCQSIKYYIMAVWNTLEKVEFYKLNVCSNCIVTASLMTPNKDINEIVIFSSYYNQ